MPMECCIYVTVFKVQVESQQLLKDLKVIDRLMMYSV